MTVRLQWMPALIVISWAVVSVAAPWLPLAPDAVELERVLALPDPHGELLGHDALGRPVADRLIAGSHTSFSVAAGVVTLSLAVGTLIGGFAALAGGWADHMVVRVIDMFLAFPGVLLAIALAGVLGPGVDNVVVALSAVGWVGFARLARAQTLSLKERDHVRAALALGGGRWRVLRWHVLPHLWAPLIIEGTFGVASVVVAEAGLSFLGLGVQPPAASWGSMILDGTRYMLVAPHLVVAPGAAIFVVVLSVNLLGDQLRDRLDVRTRGRGWSLTRR